MTVGPLSESAPLIAIPRVLFPAMRCAISLEDPQARAAVDGARRDQVAVFTQADPRRKPGALYLIGTLASVSKIGRAPCCGRRVAWLEGLRRVRSRADVASSSCVEVVFDLLPDPPEEAGRLCGLAAALRDTASRMRERFPGCVHTEEAMVQAHQARFPDQFPGVVSGLLMHVPVARQQEILETERLGARLEAALGEIHGYLARFRPRTQAGSH
jgi:ATP-dependent Lon protease